MLIKTTKVKQKNVKQKKVKQKDGASAASITIIGGSCGPTSIFLAGKLPNKPKFGKRLKECRQKAEQAGCNFAKQKKAKDLEAISYRHSIEEFEQYLKDTYNAVIIQGNDKQVRWLYHEVFTQTNPELCPKFPRLPDINSKEQIQKFNEEIFRRGKQMEDMYMQQSCEPVCYQFVFRVKKKRIGHCQVYIDRKSGIFTFDWDTCFRRCVQDKPEATEAEKQRRYMRLQKEEDILLCAASKICRDLKKFRGEGKIRKKGTAD